MTGILFHNSTDVYPPKKIPVAVRRHMRRRIEDCFREDGRRRVRKETWKPLEGAVQTELEVVTTCV